MSDRPQRSRARLVVLLGVDGSGKTTQAALATEWLQSLAKRTVLHPNESLIPLKEAFREAASNLLLPDEADLFDAEGRQLMCTAIKWNTMAKIRTVMDSADFIILDRYVHCQIASARSQRLTCAPLIEALCRTLPPADLILFLDVPILEAAERVRLRGIDVPDVAFMDAYCREYSGLADAHRFVRIDGARPIDIVHRDIRLAIAKEFGFPSKQPATSDVGQHAHPSASDHSGRQ